MKNTNMTDSKTQKTQTCPSIIPPASYFTPKADQAPMHKCADCPTMISLSIVRCSSCYTLQSVDSWDIL